MNPTCILCCLCVEQPSLNVLFFLSFEFIFSSLLVSVSELPSACWLVLKIAAITPWYRISVSNSMVNYIRHAMQDTSVCSTKLGGGGGEGVACYQQCTLRSCWLVSTLTPTLHAWCLSGSVRDCVSGCGHCVLIEWWLLQQYRSVLSSHQNVVLFFSPLLLHTLSTSVPRTF